MTLLPRTLSALAATALLSAPPALARHPTPPPDGAVVVVNRSGGAVTVSLPGRPSATLGANQTATLYGPLGEQTLRATYTQFGVERVLETERVYLSTHGRPTVVLDPEDTARVLVTNATPQVGEVLVNGRYVARLSPGQARVLSVPVGSVELDLVAGGRELDELRLTARAFAEHRFVAELPRTGDLVVTNPLPIPVELVCDRGMVRTVPAFGSTVYQGLDPAPFHLVARRVTDERIDEVTVTVRPGGRSDWRVDPPATGFVALDSEHWLKARVYADGRYVTALGPDAAGRVQLATGWHRVQVRDEREHVLLDTWVEVEPYDVAALSFGVDRHALAAADTRDRDDEDDHHDHGDRDRDDDDEHHGHGHARGASCRFE